MPQLTMYYCTIANTAETCMTNLGYFIAIQGTKLINACCAVVHGRLFRGHV